jgi:hypothetical protein
MHDNPSRRLSVSEMAGEDRRSVEHLLGRPLHDDQQLYILAFKPGTLPDEAARQRALASMQKAFAKSQQHAQQHGITDTQIDEAVDEATDRVRYAKP